MKCQPNQPLLLFSAIKFGNLLETRGAKSQCYMKCYRFFVFVGLSFWLLYPLFSAIKFGNLILTRGAKSQCYQKWERPFLIPTADSAVFHQRSLPLGSACRNADEASATRRS
jgi:hypothetical protein